jgi:membrane protein
MTVSGRWQIVSEALRGLWQDLWNFPWRNTAATLLERFREDRLGQAAGSLTFTTTISLVPLFTVALAIFSAFPAFDRLQATLQSWFMSRLVPYDIAEQVMAYLNQFAAKAGQMGWTGAVFLVITALSLVLSIDRKLNDIWRVRHGRSLTQRVLVYWAVLTLGPLLLAGSLSVTSYAISASRGLVAALPGVVQWLLDALQFVLATAGVAALYRYVPNTRVRWRHALLGGLFVGLGLEVAKAGLAWYLRTVPTYSMVYGAFATIPILLIWIYVVWVVLLLGAVITAYVPSLLRGVGRRLDHPGWRFELALEVLASLDAARHTPRRGMGLEALALALRVDPLHLEEPVTVLVELDWLGRLEEDEQRFVLLVEPAQTPLAPLAQRLLLPRTPALAALWQQSSLAGAMLGDVLPVRPPQPAATVH